MDTVRTHIKEVYRKLHVNSRAEAVLKLGRQ
jgi:DNA-binding CsgD family transcriptional regulator